MVVHRHTAGGGEGEEVSEGCSQEGGPVRVRRAGEGTSQVEEGNQQDLLSQGTAEVSGAQHEPTGRLVQKVPTKDRVLRKSPYVIVCNLLFVVFV